MDVGLPNYRHLTDDGLLALACRREDLTDEANRVLESELGARNIRSSDIAAFKTAAASAAEAQARKISVPHTYRGVGRKFYGKTNDRYDFLSETEEFDTTLWLVFAWFPIFPLATYSIRRKSSQKWLLRWLDGIQFSVVRRNPRNWEQILQTWTKAAFVVVVVLLAFRCYPGFFPRPTESRSW